MSECSEIDGQSKNKGGGGDMVLKTVEQKGGRG